MTMTETVKKTQIVATPLQDRIIVRRDEAKAETAGGLKLPEQAREVPKQGTVLAVGGGYVDPDNGRVKPLLVKPGDRVLFSPYVGTELEIDGYPVPKVVMLREADVMAIITEIEVGD